MFRTIFGYLLISIFPAAAFAAITSECPSGDVIPGRYLVRFGNHPSVSSAKPTLGLSGRVSWIHQNGSRDPSLSAKTHEPIPVVAADLAVADLSDDEARTLAESPEVLSMEPDCRVRISAIPNDPSYSTQWAHHLIGLNSAWEITRNASDVIVAVSDTGVDYNHVDLASNIWRNEAELNGLPGIDDDRNGCIDDYYGCDLADGDGDPRPGPLDSAKHGTHVAGIIGAVGNNGVGISGAAWKVKILAAKGFGNLSDTASTSDLIKTVYYSVNNGARIINCSWGIDRPPTKAESDAFKFALSKGALPIVAAGNESKDAQMTSPASLPGVLSVGSVNSNSALSSFSNYGPVVGIFAPGGDSLALGGPTDEFIYSTLPGNAFGNLRGTSMATPLVSGVAALILSINPMLSPESVVSILKDSARLKSSWTLEGSVVTTSIIDAEQALSKALKTKSIQTPKPCEGNSNCSSQETPTLEPTRDIASADRGGCSTMHSNSVLKAGYGMDWVIQGWTSLIITLILTLPIFIGSRLKE